MNRNPLAAALAIAAPILTAGLLTGGCTTTSPFADGHWIDLTYDLSEETVYWPTSDPFVLETVSEGIAEGGYYYSAYKFCAAEHGGTHIDAPIHFAEGRKTVDQLTPEELIGPAIKIDVKNAADQNHDLLIGVDAFATWEANHGRIPDGSIVLLETGFGDFWPDEKTYLGTEKRGPEGVAELHFPGLHPEAAAWLVQNRSIKAIGIDTASIDYGQSTKYESHVILMTANIPALENVANLSDMPVTGAHVLALPLRIKGGSGSPVRIVAWLPAH